MKISRHTKKATTTIEDKNNNDKLLIIKLKDLLNNYFQLNHTFNENSIVNDIYAQIDKNLVDKRFQLIYLPSKNDSFVLLSKLNDGKGIPFEFSQNKLNGKCYFLVAFYVVKLFLICQVHQMVPHD
jgi:hypothetical protein